MVFNKGPYACISHILSHTTDTHRHIFGRSRQKAKRTKVQQKKMTRYCLEKDPSVSGNHLEIKLTNDKGHLSVRVKDLGSSNGTKLNGTKIPKGEVHEIHVGDTLQLGRTSSMVVESIGVNKVVAGCPVCLQELKDLSEADRTTHVNQCLDGDGAAGKASKTLAAEKRDQEDSSRALAVVLQSDPDALIVNGTGGDSKMVSIDDVCAQHQDPRVEAVQPLLSCPSTHQCHRDH